MKTNNEIAVRKSKTEFCSDEHLVIFIDGEPLDKLIHESYPDDNLLGLIPAYLDWVENEREREIIWERTELKTSNVKIAPILVCPDDLNLVCTVVVVEVQAQQDKIKWTKLGIDSTPNRINKPERIGQQVRWLDKVGTFTFDKREYEECIDVFRKALSTKEQ